MPRFDEALEAQNPVDIFQETGDPAGAGTEEALQCVLRDVGDVADGVQSVLAQQRGGLPACAGQFPHGPGPKEG
ncbi:hypothetical protein OG289_48465 [Streptomyces sp. NBC_01235]|nr:hypothetical protein OG289_48465 [Streptomyces sp. NBC_01235]